MRFVSKCTHVWNRIIFFLIICISRSIFFLLQISRLITMYYIWDFHLWTLSVQGFTYHLRLTYAHKAIALLHTHNVCSKPSTIHRPAHIYIQQPAFIAMSWIPDTCTFTSKYVYCSNKCLKYDSVLVHLQTCNIFACLFIY